jgi:hypothetical protein
MRRAMRVKIVPVHVAPLNGSTIHLFIPVKVNVLSYVVDKRLQLKRHIGNYVTAYVLEKIRLNLSTH